MSDGLAPSAELPSVTAVVLHFRNWPGVSETIRGLCSQTIAIEVIVVDNASGDGSANEIRSAFPELTVIEAPTNRGYAAGMNLGIARVATEGVLLITHEVVLAVDAVEQMARRLQPGVGAVGPLLRYVEVSDAVFSSGGFLNGSGVPIHDTAIPTGPREVEWLDGACILLRSEAVAAAGPLEEGYFLYFEEVDYACRLRDLGWRIECTPAAAAWQQPSSLPVALFTRNLLRFLHRRDGWRGVVTGLRVTARQLRVALRSRKVARAVLLIWGAVGYGVHLPPSALSRRG